MTVLPASAVPVSVGLVLFVAAETVVIAGAFGAVVSTVSVMADDALETLPAASVALAVIVWVACVKAVDGVKLHTPLELAVVVPSVVMPSSIVTVLPASAVPVSVGLVLFVAAD